MPNFSTLNLENVRFKISNQSKLKRSYKNIVSCVIDDMIEYEFLHHRYDEKALEPVKKKANDKVTDEMVKNIFFKDILDYVKNKYVERLKRMKTQNNFIFVYRDDKAWGDTSIDELMNLDTLHKILIFTTNKDLVSEKDNIKIVLIPDSFRLLECAKYFIENFNQIWEK